MAVATARTAARQVSAASRAATTATRGQTNRDETREGALRDERRDDDRQTLGAKRDDSRNKKEETEE
jgi:hypothetical protein